MYAVMQYTLQYIGVRNTDNAGVRRWAVTTNDAARFDSASAGNQDVTQKSVA
jgi:hypothetical protein